ncbi:MAG: hypothetical protein HUJ29_00915 [Gammaproteobacteria bacterium]|nr:hypothetical protein [Gammaproteobacteria bacterium]
MRYINRFFSGMVLFLVIHMTYASSFVNTWVNQETNRPEITRIDVIDSKEVKQIQVFASCAESVCDWGVVKASESEGGFNAVYEFGFKTVQLELSPLDDRLQVSIFTDYHDGRPSTRNDYTLSR